MAYISPDKVKGIRNKIKSEFPTNDGWKFSVTGSNYTSLNVSIMKSPIKFTEKLYEQLNHFYLENYDNSETLKKISKICNETNFDKSDSMTDYHHVGYFFHLEVGKWNKPFELSK